MAKRKYKKSAPVVRSMIPKYNYRNPKEGRLQRMVDAFIKDFEQHLMFIAGFLIGVGCGIGIATCRGAIQ